MSSDSLARRTRRFAARGSSGLMFRAALAALLFLLLPAAANAYTLVLRSGRHVTIPDDFRVTPEALTYEASPGLRVTVWLSNVDAAATERANAEPAGSFAARISREPYGAAAPVQEAEGAEDPAGRKVVTNKELEASRLRRVAQEEEYERTRRARGMPSKEELRRRVEEQDRWLREWARQMEAERVAAELESLRSELVHVRRQLDGLSLQLWQQAAASGPAYPAPSYYPYLYVPPVQVITVPPFGRYGRFGRGGFGYRPHASPWPEHPRQANTFPSIHRGTFTNPPAPFVRAPRPRH